MEKALNDNIRVILGLDLGVGSIGWALIEVDESDKPVRIVDAGVRIVPLTTDQSDGFVKGNGKSVNQGRTECRTIRKGYDRYQLRRADLKEAISGLGMDYGPELVALPPLTLWKLRADAATPGCRLALSEIGRVLMHINQKRGYKHAKSDLGDRKQTEYVTSVNKRYKDIQDAGMTVGQAIYARLEASAVTGENGKVQCTYRAKGEVFPRAAYEAEFDAVMKAQQPFYKDVLTDEAIARLRNIIFYQRPLKSCKHLVSMCDFEKRPYVNAQGDIVYSGTKVAPRTSPLAQLCAIWESVNNIVLKSRRNTSTGTLFDTAAEGRYELSIDEKRDIVAFMNTHEKLTVTELLKILGLSKKHGYSAGEAVGKGLKGNTTYCRLKKALGNYSGAEDLLRFDVHNVDSGKVDEETGEIILETSNDLMEQPLYKLWHTVYSINDKEELRAALAKKFGIDDDEVVERLYAIDFTKDGFANKSARFMRRLLPYLQQGLMYSEACTYINVNHSNSLTSEEKLRRELKNRLEPLKKNELRQPVVEKILNQMINLVNAVFDRYGHVDEVRVELARELKRSKDERNKMWSDNTKRERENKQYAERILENSIAPSKNRIKKYRMWEESGKLCMYCGKTVNFKEFGEGNGAEIEHILPKSVFFDNSFSNVVCACRKCNQDKGNMTAFDYVKKMLPDKFDSYVARVEELYENHKISKTKHDRLLMSQTDIPEDFLNRDLRETQYISKKAKELLLSVVRDVSVTTGSVTDFFRHVWGYDEILHDLNLEIYKMSDRTQMMEYIHNGQRHVEERITDWSKRLDHRHHAIDALTVALMKPAYINRLNRLNTERDRMYEELKKQSPEYQRKHSLLEDWSARQPHFTVREVVEAVKRIAVSLKAGKKVVTPGKRLVYKNGKRVVKQTGILVPRGPLTKESVYGKIKVLERNRPLKQLLLSPEEIADTAVREKVMEVLGLYGNDAKKALAYIRKHPVVVNGREVTAADCYVERFVIKTDITALKCKDVESIVDEGVKRAVRARMAECGNNDSAFQKSLVDRPVCVDKNNRYPVYAVRLFDNWGPNSIAPVKKDSSGKTIGYAAKQNNHHVALYKSYDDKMHEIVLPFWDAVLRKRYGLPVVVEKPDEVWDDIAGRCEDIPDDVLSTLPQPGWKLFMTMQLNEMFVLGLSDAEFMAAIKDNNKAVLTAHLYRVQKLGSLYYYFRFHTQTTVDAKNESKDMESKTLFRIQSLGVLLALNPIKVRVNYLGEIIPI